MSADSMYYEMVSKNIPKCPNCKKDLPIPGFVGYKYECPNCGENYSVDMELIRIFKTGMWPDEDGND